MTSVLVVSRNTTLGMLLSRNELDVDEARPDGTEGWIEEVPGHAVVLLDVGTIDQAEQQLKALVSAGLRVPVLLVGGDGQDWTALAGRFCSGLALVTLPLNAGVVLDELGKLVDGERLDTFASRRSAGQVAAEPAFPEVQPSPDDPTPLFDVVVVARDAAPTIASHSRISPGAGDIVHPSPPLELAEMPDLVDAMTAAPAAELVASPPPAPAEAEHRAPAVEPVRRLHPAAEPVRRLPPAAEPVRRLPPAVEVAPPSPPVQAPDPVRHRRPQPASREPAAPATVRHERPQARPMPEGASGLSLLELTAALKARVGGLYSVDDVAEFVLTEIIDRCGAAAGAALMRADGAWVVEAGVGLRPLERRLEVPSDHWLTRRVVVEELGLLVARSDGSGHELVGVPLASWEYLAAVYLPQGELLVLLASAERSFDHGHLKLVRDIDEECKDLLHEACAVRDLARLLAPFADEAVEGYSR